MDDSKGREIDITRCPVCLDDFKNTKLLPCLHSFCLHCLQALCNYKKPGDAVPCPVCRQEFEIPDKCLGELPHNFFLQNLVDARKASIDQPLDVLCEVCETVDEEPAVSTVPVPTATKFCVDCNQKLCKSCSRPHLVMRGGPHQVTDLRDELNTQIILRRGSYCDQHPDKQLEFYCFTCQKNVCTSCCIVTHPQPEHKCKEIAMVAKAFVVDMESDVKSLLPRVSKYDAELKQTDDEDERFTTVIHGIKTSIKQRIEDMKRMIDSQVDKLLTELQAVEQKKEKEIIARKDRLELGLRAMESFNAYSLELQSKGSACDITRAANDLRKRAEELLQTYVSCGDYCAPDVKFVPVNIDEQLSGGLNFVGRILMSTTEGICVVTTLSGSGPVVGMTTLNQELFVLHERRVHQVDVYSTNSSTLYTHQRQFSVKELSNSDANDMTSCVRRKCLYISDFSNLCVHKVALNGDVAAKWPVPNSPAGLSLTPSGNLLVTCSNSGKLVELNSETGRHVREIALPSDIQSPLHTMQLSNQLFVVTHAGNRLLQFGVFYGDVHRVCVVDVDGNVSVSYGSHPGSDVIQLNVPRHVAIRTDYFIFVADRDNRRVALFTPSLQLVRHIKLEYLPVRLHLDHVTRRMYIGYWDTGDVTVMQV